MKVVVTGSTGFIGSALVAALRDRGDDVTALVRNVERAKAQLGEGIRVLAGDLESQGAWCDSLEGADAIAHLAGEPIAGKKWDSRQKQILRDSRVESTRTIVEVLGKLPAAQRPKALVTASGIDYYPFALHETDFDDDEVTESDPPAETFLGRLCRDWEREAQNAEKLGIRVANMRTGMVLGQRGGALAKMTTPFKLFAGGRLGSGRQWVSWIHLDDVIAAYIAALTDDRFTGPINLVTSSVRNYDFSRELGHAMHRPSWLPVPGFAIKAAVGSELAQSILHGRRAMPAKLRELGFTWKYPTLDRALAASV